uniref:hypothetical protein n=1 Tax=Phocaeicola dorei TaxID=357276 RepID=UPI00402A1561
MNQGLNSVFKCVLYLVIVRYAINIFQQFIKMTSGMYDNSICFVTILVSVIMIILLSNIIRIKRNALNFFFVFQYINALLIGIMEQKGDYLTPFIIATIFSGIMAGLLFLKKDGVSGWKLFYPSIEKVSDPEQIKSENEIDEKPQEEFIEPNKSVKESVQKQVLSSEQPIIEIPKKEDGTIDYDAMSIKQQFEYTCKTESLSIAVQDLKKEISRRKKEIKKLEKELSSCTGGKLAKSRDVIRAKRTEVQEIEILIPASFKKKTLKKRNISILICAILAIAILPFSYLIYNNNQKKNEIMVYRSSVYLDMARNGYRWRGDYEDYVKCLALPLRKFAIYSDLKYKDKGLSYNNFASKLGYENPNLIQELYDLLIEKGVNVNKKIGADKFPEWIKEDGNFYTTYLILKRKTNFKLENLGDEVGIWAMRIVDESDYTKKLIEQENKINELLDKNDETRKDNIKILYEAIFNESELKSTFSEEKFREGILESEEFAVKVYNILLKSGVDIFEGYNNPEAKFLHWLYEE